MLLHAGLERITFEVLVQPLKYIRPRLNVKPIPIVIGKLPNKWEQRIAQCFTDDCLASQSLIQIHQVGRGRGALFQIVDRLSRHLYSEGGDCL